MLFRSQIGYWHELTIVSRWAGAPAVGIGADAEGAGGGGGVASMAAASEDIASPESGGGVTVGLHENTRATRASAGRSAYLMSRRAHKRKGTYGEVYQSLQPWLGS